MQPIERLLDIMRRLRDPETGCPWDRAQDWRSIVPHTLEEAYEVAEAIENGDMDALRDELGDLLFQVIYYCQFAREEGRFDFADVVEAICDKLVRRHPHVFGDERVKDAESQSLAWEAHKRRERMARGGGLLEGVARTLPALSRARKLQQRAASVGFDWQEIGPVFDKLHEEIEELRQALARGGPQEAIEEELGDLLFVCVNLARHAGVDPERALRQANRKFERRFAHIERRLREQGREPSDTPLAVMDALWDEAKEEGR